MAKILGMLPAALVAARGGMSQNAFENLMRSQGLGARASEMRALFKIATGIVRRNPDEIFRDPELIPTGTEQKEWPVKKATGVVQVVTLVYRDKTTGKQAVTYYRVHSENGIVRQEAVDKAVDAYSDQAERYKQTLISAVHTSVYRNTPIGI